MLAPNYTEDFKRQYKKLPLIVREKFKKQLKYLVVDFRHPSLRSRKMSGLDRYEARIDRSYRFTYEIESETVKLFSVGSHDTGLGKK